MYASTKRLSNSSNNIANIHSTTSLVKGEKVNEPYKPNDVIQSSQSSGGVRAEERVRANPTVSYYQPGHPSADAEGVVDYPNVNLDEELVNTEIATYDFKANAKVIKAADEMTEDLLDITA
ncbi:MAG: hypothetical protein MRY32_02170 [Rickettsiales bacterium]|nr:hypothetical protein [Rickettsiales bacterium]